MDASRSIDADRRSDGPGMGDIIPTSNVPPTRTPTPFALSTPSVGGDTAMRVAPVQVLATLYALIGVAPGIPAGEADDRSRQPQNSPGGQQRDGTTELWKGCQGGDSAACSRLKAANEADLTVALDHIRNNHTDVLGRIDGTIDIVWEDSLEYWQARDGHVDPLDSEIHLSRRYASMKEFVATVGHELLHRGDGVWGRIQTNIQDNFSPLPNSPWGVGERHTEIYRRGGEIGESFERTR